MSKRPIKPALFATPSHSYGSAGASPSPLRPLALVLALERKLLGRANLLVSRRFTLCIVSPKHASFLPGAEAPSASHTPMPTGSGNLRSSGPVLAG